MTSAPRPILMVIGGSNGAGKSTLTASMVRATGIPVVDPDAIARSLRPDAPERAATQAAREVLRLQQQYLTEGHSFAVETTLAGTAVLYHMQEARDLGFEVHLVYIGVEDVQIVIDRIAVRVARGGHNIPEDVIRRRYSRSLANLKDAVALADQVTCIDNTSDAGPQQVLTMDNGVVTMRAAQLPTWITSWLGGTD